MREENEFPRLEFSTMHDIEDEDPVLANALKIIKYSSVYKFPDSLLRTVSSARSGIRNPYSSSLHSVIDKKKREFDLKYEVWKANEEDREIRKRYSDEPMIISSSWTNTPLKISPGIRALIDSRLIPAQTCTNVEEKPLSLDEMKTAVDSVRSLRTNWSNGYLECWYEPQIKIIEPYAVMYNSDPFTKEELREIIDESKDRLDKEIAFRSAVINYFINKHLKE